MTTVFVIAAVMLGAEGGTPAPVVQLKQPSVAEQSQPVVVDLGALSTPKSAAKTNGGLIKPVGYETKHPQTAKSAKIAAVSAKGGFSLVQDASPSDGVAPRPMKPMQIPTPPSPVQLPEEKQDSHFVEPYVAEDDFTTASCGCGDSVDSGCSSCDTGGNSCGCHKAHGCNLGCHGGCHGCGYGHGHGGFYARHCLPSPWHAPGNMVPHIPYVAYPKTYYYFRPYNMLHIPDQQARAAGWVENPALPYSNRIFDKVYAELEPVLNAPGEVVPPPVSTR